MAVVQISRIQIRRGQKNQGSGLPQLASGELGWAIDTRELYIGNGAVSEGAPAVGNTKVLTEHDNLFTLVDTYAYRANDSFVVTGETATDPVYRTLQDRLDDIVSGRAFGLTGETSQTATIKLQRALDQLYLNSATVTSPQSRVVLYLEPGEYILDDTVYLPPHTTIIGAGIDKTIIRQTVASPVFQTQNELSIGGSKSGPSDDSGSSYLTQARNIRLENLTLETTAVGGKGLVLQSCRDSIFNNIKLKGTWTFGDSVPTDFSSDIGLELNSLSGSVESSNNYFSNIEITSWAYAVMSNWDIDNNTWTDCKFSTLGYGIAFGVDMLLGAPSVGTSVGPSHNLIVDSTFSNIEKHGIWVENGTANVSRNNKFTLVGNNGGSEGQPETSIIKYAVIGNESVGDYFSRTAALSYNQSYLTGVEYIPEVEGIVNWIWGFEHSITLTQGDAVKVMRLPQATNQGFEIDYTLVSNNYEAARSGVMTVMVNGYTGDVEISDDYHYSGNENYLADIYFDAIITNEAGDTSEKTISILCTSSMPGDDQTEFKFKVKNKQSSVI